MKIMQTQFDTFLARQGEHAVQAILENWERFTGHRYEEPIALETRWAIFINETAETAYGTA
jgi:hypothetical protein